MARAALGQLQNCDLTPIPDPDSTSSSTNDPDCPPAGNNQNTSPSGASTNTNNQGSGLKPPSAISKNPDALSAAHLAAAGNRADPGYGGNCTPDEYDKLKNKQDTTCGDHKGGPGGYMTAESLGGCKGTKLAPVDKNGLPLTSYDLSIRRDAWLNCGVARDDLAQKCFAGGDNVHKDQINQAQNAALNCEKLLQ